VNIKGYPKSILLGGMSPDLVVVFQIHFDFAQWAAPI